MSKKSLTPEISPIELTPAFKASASMKPSKTGVAVDVSVSVRVSNTAAIALIAVKSLAIVGAIAWIIRKRRKERKA